MVAAELHNDISTFKLILPSVPYLSYINKDRRTVLHKASMYRRTEIVNLLISEEHILKHDFMLRDKYGKLALDENVIQDCIRKQDELEKRHKRLRENEREVENRKSPRLA